MVVGASRWRNWCREREDLAVAVNLKVDSSWCRCGRKWLRAELRWLSETARALQFLCEDGGGARVAGAVPVRRWWCARGGCGNGARDLWWNSGELTVVAAGEDGGAKKTEARWW